MADPLSQLRQYHINGKEIKEHNGYIIFGEHGWPKNVNTNYQIYSTDDDKSKKEYYTLGCLLYFLRLKDFAHTYYVKQAGCDNIPAVHRPDRKHLLSYLTGESQTAPGIDKNAPIPALRVPVSEIYKKDPPSGSEPQPSTSSQGPSSQGQSDTSRLDVQSQSARKRLPHEEDITKVREEFAARLNEPSAKKIATIIPSEVALKPGETNESSAAISKFGPEKLAAMRAKHLAVKRTQIIDADAEPNFGSNELGRREDLLYAMDADKFKIIKSKEKVWRTRTSILQSQTKNFGKSILGMLDMLNKSDDPNKKQLSKIPPMPVEPHSNPYHQPNHPQQQQSIQRNSYNRYDQERFVKLDIGVEIDTKKSFVGGVSNGIVPYSGQSQAVQPISRPPVAKNGIPPVPRPMDVVDNRSIRKPTKRSVVPIIVIPATTTSIINMYNAATILQDLTYVEGKPGTSSRQNEILIQRKKQDGTSAVYKVMDNPLKLEGHDWNRVVAVFVQGPAWQFKGWPYNGSPVEIFSNIKGFHLKWDESKLDENVAKWNVHVLDLSRTKRHLDKATLMKFWSSLDSFMMKYKNFLKF